MQNAASKSTSVPTLRHRRTPSANLPDHDGPADAPVWDRECQVLHRAGLLVKGFRVPAENQVLLLSAFEEQAWCRRIDDPLPHKLDMDSKRRLNRTIESLNRCQQHRLIRFRGDGTGRGVCWEPIEE